MLAINHILLWTPPGGTEWLLIFLVLLLFFGGKRIPKLMRGLGRGVKEFKDAKDSMDKPIEDEDDADTTEVKLQEKETHLENK